MVWPYVAFKSDEIGKNSQLKDVKCRVQNMCVLPVSILQWNRCELGISDPGSTGISFLGIDRIRFWS